MVQKSLSGIHETLLFEIVPSSPLFSAQVESLEEDTPVFDAAISTAGSVHFTVTLWLNAIMAFQDFLIGEITFIQIPACEIKGTVL